MIRSLFLRLMAFLVVLMPLSMVIAWLVPIVAQAHREIAVFQLAYAVSHAPVHLVSSPEVHVDVPLGSSGLSRVVGSPSITADFVNRVLDAYHSPALGEGQHIYDDGVQFGIDPVFVLAFFMHESSFGRMGEATASLNPGNLRCLPDVVCRDNFAWFSSWAEGFHAWYVLLRNLYINQWHAVTVEQIIPHYAPATDHNNESGYIRAVLHAVQIWRMGTVFVQ